MDYEKIEKRLGYTFGDKSLLKTALTLASADRDDNNQTLEFFGDAILEFLVSEKIFDERKSEGELTEMRKAYVADSALTPVSLRLGLPDFFIKGAGDNVLNKSIPSAYEAVTAAIYLDGGMDSARKFVLSTLDFAPVAAQKNYKGDLQEYLQGRGQPLPVYFCRDIGDKRAPYFSVTVECEGKKFEGKGPNKKEAQQAAAHEALKWLNNYGR